MVLIFGFFMSKSTGNRAGWYENRKNCFLNRSTGAREPKREGTPFLAIDDTCFFTRDCFARKWSWAAQKVKKVQYWIFKVRFIGV